MTARSFVYGKLSSFTPLVDLIGGSTDPRIFSKKSMTSLREDHPYIVYKLGNETNEDLAEDQQISRQYFQVWVHDYHDQEVGDYARIDAVMSQVRKAFHLNNSTVDVWTVRYLETSQDLNDDTLNTLFRYARFQLIKKEM